MAAASTDELEQAILRAGLLSHQELSEALAQLPPDTREAGPETVAQEFVRRGRLTEFQKQMLLAGQSHGLVLGEYTLLSLLGAGGMGRVFRALHRRMGREVALKVLPDSVAHNPDRRARFSEEALALAALNHPHIGAIYGVEESGADVALVLELVDGPTLAERLTAGRLANYARDPRCTVLFSRVTTGHPPVLLQGVVTLGDVMVHQVGSSYLRSEGPLLAAIGLDNVAVIATRDAVLVSAKDRVQEVKTIVEGLKAAGRSEAVAHPVVYRPWGSYQTVDLGERFQVKRITVKPGARLSLQKHAHRAEHWVVVNGTAIVTRDDEIMTLHENESTYIPQGEKHRLRNPGKIDLEIIEVQTGSYLGEDDIERFDDAYGR